MIKKVLFFGYFKYIGVYIGKFCNLLEELDVKFLK